MLDRKKGKKHLTIKFMPVNKSNLKKIVNYPATYTSAGLYIFFQTHQISILHLDRASEEPMVK